MVRIFPVKRYLFASLICLVTSNYVMGACTSSGSKPTRTKPCCSGLFIKDNGQCFLDTSPAPEPSCSTDSDCTDNKGCFTTLSQSDAFSAAGTDGNQDKSKITQMLQSEFGPVTSPADDETSISRTNGRTPIRPVGQPCWGNFMCDSYSCERQDNGTSKCANRKTCRLAKEGETAGTGVNCLADLVKDSSGKCQLPPEETSDRFLGLSELIQVKRVNPNSCQFELFSSAQNHQQIMELSRGALKFWRAMEILLTKNARHPNSDCLKLLPALEGQIGEPLKTTRILALNSFNTAYLSNKNDFEQILRSENNSGLQMESLVKQKALFQLYKQWEESNIQLIEMPRENLSILNGEMGGWDDDDDQWKVLRSTKESCFSWDDEVHEAFKRYYIVKESLIDSMVQKPYINQSLEAISGIVVSARTFNGESSLFSEPVVHLMEPLPAKAYTDLGESTGFLGGWEREINTSRQLDETLTAWEEKVAEYYKEFLQRDPQFISEPELLSLSQQHCFLDLNKPGCVEAKAYVEEMGQIIWALSFSYSYHKYPNFSHGFHKRSSSWRRRLFSTLVTVGTNLQNYYNALVSLRDQQIQCIDKQISMVPDGDGETITPGGAPLPDLNPNSYTGNSVTGLPDAGPINKLPSQSDKLVNGSIDLKTATLKNDLSGSFKSGSSVDRSSTAGASTSSSNGSNSNAAIAAKLKERINSMQAANKKAKSLGIDVDSQDKAAVSSLTSLGKNQSSSQNANKGSSSNLGGLGSSGSRAVLDPENKQGQSSSSTENENKTDGSAGSSSTAGIGRDLLSNGHDESSNTPSVSDDMSDEEKENMMANYERSKSQYQSNEDDGLFKILSKAYVRNLEKVLKRKKVEEP
jgi:hypothetical protein